LVVLAVIATGFSLFYLKSVLLPFVLALFIVIGCRPILEFVQRKLQLPRFLAFVVTFMLGFLLLLGFAFLIWYSINDLAKNTDVYQTRMNAIIAWVVERIPDPEVEATSTSDTTVNQVDSGENLKVDSTGESTADALGKELEEFLTWISAYIQTQMISVAGSLSSLLSYGVLILIFVFFLLLGNPAPERTTTPSGNQGFGILAEIEQQIRKYLLMKTVISLVTGLVFGFVLWAFGVPLAIVFGFLAFLLNFIPNIGPLISTILPVPFLVLNSGMSPASAIVCFILIGTIQFVSGNVIETRMMGKSFDVSPIALLLALMFFGLVWGIVGMFLATPIVSIIKIVLQQRESTRPIANLMAGRLDVFDSSQS
jgi:AI-2 transport protein TqsA